MLCMPANVSVMSWFHAACTKQRCWSTMMCVRLFAHNNETLFPLSLYRTAPRCMEWNPLLNTSVRVMTCAVSETETRARFMSLAQSKLRLCSANHRAGYFSNLACGWLSLLRASDRKTFACGQFWLDLLILFNVIGRSRVTVSMSLYNTLEWCHVISNHLHLCLSNCLYGQQKQ